MLVAFVIAPSIPSFIRAFGKSPRKLGQMVDRRPDGTVLGDNNTNRYKDNSSWHTP